MNKSQPLYDQKATPLGELGAGNLFGVEGEFLILQGYLAHKKPPPPLEAP